MKLRAAKVSDLTAITQLINEAYSVESSFKAGDRITIEEVTELFNKGHFLVLEHNEVLEANVYLELRGDRAYLGLLSCVCFSPASWRSRKLTPKS